MKRQNKTIKGAGIFVKFNRLNVVTKIKIERIELEIFNSIKFALSK